jgi:Protein of unknown function (DUF3592)
MQALPFFLAFGLFLVVGAIIFVSTIVRMFRGRYDPWIRCIADLLVGVCVMGFAVGMAMLVLHAGHEARLIPGFAVLGCSGLALVAAFIIRTCTGGGIGPTPDGPDPATVEKYQAVATKVLRFIGAPPGPIAAGRQTPSMPVPQPTLAPPSSPNPCVEPPRPVPFLTRLHVLFGGAFNQFGWLFFGFGMVFFWLFACRADFTSWYRFRGPIASVQGRVTDSSKTGASEGGSKGHGGTPIYRNDYSFVVNDQEYHGASYALGRELSVGRPVTVQYLPGKPQCSRVQGMRTNVFGPAVAFVILFPLLGLARAAWGVASGLRACRLLADGIPASGSLMTKQDTNVSVNRRMVYEYTFAFKTRHGEVCTASTKTTADRFVNGAQEHLLYDPLKPERVLLLDNLPGETEVGADGHLTMPRPVLTLKCLILPLATLIGHGYWALWLLRH